jgi:hypothetical protein
LNASIKTYQPVHLKGMTEKLLLQLECEQKRREGNRHRRTDSTKTTGIRNRDLAETTD